MDTYPIMPTWVYRVAIKYGLDTQLENPIKKYPIYMLKCVHRSVCLSVKQARFVTMGAIDPLLCEEIPLGLVTWQNQKLAPYDYFPGL
jgi:hypothetical protein